MLQADATEGARTGGDQPGLTRMVGGRRLADKAQALEHLRVFRALRGLGDTGEGARR